MNSEIVPEAAFAFLEFRQVIRLHLLDQNDALLLILDPRPFGGGQLKVRLELRVGAGVGGTHEVDRRLEAVGAVVDDVDDRLMNLAGLCIEEELPLAFGRIELEFGDNQRISRPTVSATIGTRRTRPISDLALCTARFTVGASTCCSLMLKRARLERSPRACSSKRVGDFVCCHHDQDI